MSSRRNGSVSRAAETASKTRLHMDRNPQHSRITDPANPAGRRKEIDNVMKRARQASPGSWDKRLLEVEEKDPNRWRHTGYKQLYMDGSGSDSSRRSRSPRMRRSRSPITSRRSRSPLASRRSRSPIARRSRSPLASRRSRSPRARASRSPIRSRISRSPIRGRVSRSPIRGRISRSRVSRSPVRPRTSRSPVRRDRRPRPEPPISRRSPVHPARRRSRSPRPRARPQPRPPRPPSPPDPRKSSGSSSSVSSCSNESCSVCSGKNKKPPPLKAIKPRIEAGSPSRVARPARAVQPTRELLKAREASKRTREEKVLEWQRTQVVAAAAPPPRIKREGERRPPASTAGGVGGAPAAGGADSGEASPARVSPATLAAALNDSDSDTRSDNSSDPPHRLTLSERFGKMAQWSQDRSARLENMKITRRESTLHVRIEGKTEPSPTRSDHYPGLEAAPSGSYPEELLAAAPGGLPSWDDVRVRYDYYKKRGYLRGLTLSDYVKWEEWWYKYQEWLKRERAYERWADGEPPRRERRRRGGRHRRS